MSQSRDVAESPTLTLVTLARACVITTSVATEQKSVGKAPHAATRPASALLSRLISRVTPSYEIANSHSYVPWLSVLMCSCDLPVS